MPAFLSCSELPVHSADNTECCLGPFQVAQGAGDQWPWLLKAVPRLGAAVRSGLCLSSWGACPSSVPKALRKTGLVSTFLWGRVFHWARLEEAGSREALGLCESWLTRTDQWLCHPALGGGASLGEVSSTDSWAPHMHTVDPEVWSGGTVSIKE